MEKRPKPQFFKEEPELFNICKISKDIIIKYSSGLPEFEKINSLIEKSYKKMFEADTWDAFGLLLIRFLKLSKRIMTRLTKTDVEIYEEDRITFLGSLKELEAAFSADLKPRGKYPDWRKLNFKDDIE